MKIRTGGLGVVAAAVLVLGVAPLMGQRAGFQIGIAPPVNTPIIVSGFGPPAVLPFPAVPTTAFGAFPGFGIQPGSPFGFPGFGIQPGSPFGFPPVSTFGATQPPAIITRFGRVPAVVPGSVIVPGSVFVPGSVIVPGSVVVPAPFVTPVPFPFNTSAAFPLPNVPSPVFGPTQVVTPGSVFFERPQSSFGPPARGIPPIGTPRAEVLKTLGQPTVTVITNNGETLHFNGGVTVIIQNGQVAGPK
jgi:hypothetical protein